MHGHCAATHDGTTAEGFLFQRMAYHARRLVSCHSLDVIRRHENDCKSCESQLLFALDENILLKRILGRVAETFLNPLKFFKLFHVSFVTLRKRYIFQFIVVHPIL